MRIIVMCGHWSLSWLDFIAADYTLYSVDFGLLSFGLWSSHSVHSHSFLSVLASTIEFMLQIYTLTKL